MKMQLILSILPFFQWVCIKDSPCVITGAEVNRKQIYNVASILQELRVRAGSWTLYLISCCHLPALHVDENCRQNKSCVS